YTLGSISADSLPDADPLKCDFSSYCNKYAAFIIKFLAIEKPYQHKKLGTSILPYLIKFFTARCANFPVRYITIEALPECVAWYERIGFTQTTRANSDKNILMYYDAIEKSRVDLLMEHFLDN
ncbi:MAG: GNAT family N-acetyltransferase, partial [Oscillospiraceae bacterium]|nr:GNAT family N-acetyltransferase [Oscillospiraceae bacterium]